MLNLKMLLPLLTNHYVICLCYHNNETNLDVREDFDVAQEHCAAAKGTTATITLTGIMTERTRTIHTRTMPYVVMRAAEFSLPRCRTKCVPSTYMKIR